MMFNGKVIPRDYVQLRDVVMQFLSVHKLTIQEASLVLYRLEQDLQRQECSGIITEDLREGETEIKETDPKGAG